MTESSGNAVAPAGSVYVCTACGKRSRDQYGEQKISAGWDESCMLNAMLCEESMLVIDDHGRVVEIKLIGSKP